MAHQQMNAGGGSANAMSSLMGLYNTAKEKFDASGGNEALGRVSSAIPESTRNMMGSLFKREHIRGVGVFFGLGEERAFYVEKVPSLLVERLRHNATFFYLNYALMTVAIFCVMALTSPIAIIGIAVLAAAWMWLIRASESGVLQISNFQIPQKTAAAGMALFSVFALFWLLSGVFWWTTFSSGFFILLHAFFRDASMHKDMDDAVAMEGDLHLGEDSAFLNQQHHV